MSPNLLDFTTDGQAIINMPNYKDISFLENFGFSPIESVELAALHRDVQTNFHLSSQLLSQRDGGG